MISSPTRQATGMKGESLKVKNISQLMSSLGYDKDTEKTLLRGSQISIYLIYNLILYLSFRLKTIAKQINLK